MRRAATSPGGPGAPGSIVALLCALVPLAGCAAPQEADGQAAGPSYEQVRSAYNRRAERIEQLRARAVVEARWVDERGRKRFEQGDGLLIVRTPHELALTVGKLGEVMFWLGTDEQRFWLFDLQPPSPSPRTAIVGRHEDAEAGRLEELPLPVPPGRLIGLLGIAALPERGQVGSAESAEGAEAVREKTGQTTVILDPGAGAGLPGADEATVMKWRLDERWRPVEIGHFKGGQPLIMASLSRYEALPLEGVPPGGWPDVATRIELRVPARDATMTLFLEDLTDGKGEGKVRDAQFDFEQLVRTLRPQRVRVLRAEEGPAEGG